MYFHYNFLSSSCEFPENMAGSSVGTSRHSTRHSTRHFTHQEHTWRRLQRYFYLPVAAHDTDRRRDVSTGAGGVEGEGVTATWPAGPVRGSVL